MSYLGVPRIHFSGTFTSDPSTVNNAVANYKTVVNPMWNQNGRHHFSFNAKVTHAVDTSGNAIVPPKTDPVIGADVSSAVFGRLVDLDPSFQFGSEIWGMSVMIKMPGGTSVTGKMDVTSMRRLWFGRAGPGMPGAGAVYQSVLRDLQFPLGPFLNPGVFEQLSADELSIMFAVYNYNATPGAGAFTKGNIVGAIGPVTAGEPVHFPATRRMKPSAQGAFEHVPFAVDKARKVIVLDMSHTLPEKAPGDERVDQGKLEVMIPAKGITIGQVDFSKAHYLKTVGIEELPLSAAALAAIDANPVAIRASKPVARLIVSEAMRFIDVSDTVFRLNPGEKKTVTFTALMLGKPIPNQKITLQRTKGAPSAGIIFPGSVTTGANGQATATFEGGDTGRVRAAQDIDGQVYTIGFFLGAAGPSTLQGDLHIRVYDKFTVPSSPKWADVSGILQQYSRLYPAMRSIVDLGNRARLTGWEQALIASMERPITEANYMPVTRDLSENKRLTLIKWLRAGMP